MAEPIRFADVLLDVEAVLRAFAEHEVEFVLVGGVAGLLAGSPLPTEDVDLTPAGDRANLGRCAVALNALGAQWRVPGLREGLPPPAPITGDDLVGKMSAAFVTHHGFLDLVLTHSDGARYVDLTTDAVAVTVYGLTVRRASLDALISAKEAAGRDKDARALPFLHELRRRR